jgi:hypothetical protein
MVAIRIRYDGRTLVPQEPVELPKDCVLIAHVETEARRPADESILEPLIIPVDPEATKRLVDDPENRLENL